MSQPNQDGLRPGYALMPGVPEAAREMFTQYRPSEQGVCALSPEMNITLPYAEWAWYEWVERMSTGALAAGETDPATVWTVPQDERNYLVHMRVALAGGDNDVQNLRLFSPVGYFASTGDASIVIAQKATPDQTMIWPDPSNIQTLVVWWNGPILLEPGTLVQLTPAGAGVAATTWTVYLALRRSLIVRALVPQ